MLRHRQQIRPRTSALRKRHVCSGCSSQILIQAHVTSRWAEAGSVWRFGYHTQPRTNRIAQQAVGDRIPCSAVPSNGWPACSAADFPRRCSPRRRRHGMKASKAPIRRGATPAAMPITISSSSSVSRGMPTPASAVNGCRWPATTAYRPTSATTWAVPASSTSCCRRCGSGPTAAICSLPPTSSCPGPSTAQTGKPLQARVFGAVYNNPGHWQQLGIEQIRLLLQRQLVVMRSRLRTDVDGREAYIAARAAERLRRSRCDERLDRRLGNCRLCEFRADCTRQAVAADPGQGDFAERRCRSRCPAAPSPAPSRART